MRHVCVTQVPQRPAPRNGLLFRGEERKRPRLEEEEARTGIEMEIIAYGIPIDPVTSFKYLGRVLSEADNNCPAVVHNLRKTQNKCERLSRVLSREGADARTLGRIYMAVFQAVMIYESETWMMTPCIGSVLGGFHHRVARRLTGQKSRRGGYSG